MISSPSGVGCALSALVAAFLATIPDMPLEAAVAACALMSAAADGCAHADPGTA